MIKSRAAGSTTSSTTGGLASGGVTAGAVGDDCDWRGGCGSGGFGELSVATTSGGAGSAGFVAADGLSAIAVGFSATAECGGFSATRDGVGSSATGFGGAV